MGRRSGRRTAARRKMVSNTFLFFNHDSQIKPACPRAHVGDVGNPGVVWAVNGKPSLQRIRSEKSGDTSGVPGRAIAVERFDVIGPHNPSDSMLATGLARFAQIEKDPRGSVDPVAYRIGRADEAEQPLILQCSIGEGVT